MFKHLYSLRFIKKGTPINPVYHILLYYRSRFIANLGCVDHGAKCAMINFNTLLYYYTLGFRLRKYHRYLDCIYVLVVGMSSFSSDKFMAQVAQLKSSRTFIPRRLYTPRRIQLLTKFILQPKHKY